MITLRATTIESFRLFMEPDLGFVTPEEMDDRLRGEEMPSTPEQRLGTAWHEAVAGTYTGAVLFDDASIEKARRGLGGVPSEVYGSVVLDVYGTSVRVTGHADYLLGLDLLDLKSSKKTIPPDRHADSMQWRCYCLIFDAKRVTYRHCQLDEDDDGVIYAKSIEDVQMYPYPEMRRDVLQCIDRLLAYADERGIDLDVPDEER